MLNSDFLCGCSPYNLHVTAIMCEQSTAGMKWPGCTEGHLMQHAVFTKHGSCMTLFKKSDMGHFCMQCELSLSSHSFTYSGRGVITTFGKTHDIQSREHQILLHVLLLYRSKDKIMKWSGGLIQQTNNLLTAWMIKQMKKGVILISDK